MIINNSRTIIALILSLFLTACTNGPSVEGAEAILVPITQELKLGSKSASLISKQKSFQRAYDFIVEQLEDGAEEVIVYSLSNRGKELQEKLKRELGKYQKQVKYELEMKDRSFVDLRIISSRTQMIMPACQSVSQTMSWHLQDGCFVERARNKQLVSPSSLLPHNSEMFIEQERVN